MPSLIDSPSSECSHCSILCRALTLFGGICIRSRFLVGHGKWALKVRPVAPLSVDFHCNILMRSFCHSVQCARLMDSVAAVLLGGLVFFPMAAIAESRGVVTEIKEGCAVELAPQPAIDEVSRLPLYMLTLEPALASLLNRAAAEAELASAKQRVQVGPDAVAPRGGAPAAAALPPDILSDYRALSDAEKARFWFRRSELCKVKTLLGSAAPDRYLRLLDAYLSVSDGRVDQALEIAAGMADQGRIGEEPSAVMWLHLASVLELFASGGGRSERLTALANLAVELDAVASALQTDARLVLAASLLRSGDAMSALRGAGTVALEDRDAARALLLAGWAQMNNGQPTKALVYWREVAARGGDDPEVYEARAFIPLALWAAGAREVAIAAYEENLSFFASEIQRIALTVVAVERGQFEQSVLNVNDCGQQCNWLDDMDVPSVWPFRSVLARTAAESIFQEAVRELRASLAIQDWLDELEEKGLISQHSRLRSGGSEAVLGAESASCANCASGINHCPDDLLNASGRHQHCPHGQTNSEIFVDLSGSVSRLVARSRSTLRQLAVRALHAQQARLELHIERTLLAIAQIHDVVAMHAQVQATRGLVHPQ